ncbi:hypothetical protein [Paenibacillus sp. USHLN196]|uniref:hypothetical protein n=1 Tax=Paenibacillus sp. USHLN196 TaxID=3081291 RepID=UPI0030160BCF
MTESTFEKPVTVIIDALSYLSEVLKNGLKKDLQKHQKPCDDCKGTGLEITNQIYGMSDDPDKSKLFPYDNQYIISCRHCHSGVVNLCEFCNEKLSRFNDCDCPDALHEKDIQRAAREQELWDKAIKLESSDDIAKKMGMYQSDDYPYNDGYFASFDEFIEAWEDSHEPDDPKPIYVWGTRSISLSLNADDILDRESEDLHEDALDNIEGKDELQKFLDEWCSKQKWTTTYYGENNYAIRIPWDN